MPLGDDEPFVLRDHDPKPPISIRFRVMGAIVKEISQETGHIVCAEVHGQRALGDWQCWRFWQGQSRGFGSLSPIYPAIVEGQDGPAVTTPSEPNASDGSFSRPGGAVTTGVRSRAAGPAAGVRYASARPIRTDEFAADDRYWAESNALPKFWPSFPRGFVGIATAGTEERRQSDLWLPVDPRIVVPGKNGRDVMATLFSDLEPEDEISEGDPTKEPGADNKGGRVARSSTLFRVVKMPDGLGTLKVSEGDALALQFAASEQGGMAGYGPTYGILDSGAAKSKVTTPSDGAPKAPGAVTTGGAGGELLPPTPSGSGHDPAPLTNAGTAPAVSGSTSVTGPGAKKKEKQKRGIGLLAWEGDGPLRIGNEADKHQIGVNADGEPVNPQHIASDAFFYKSVTKDAPLEFAEDNYPKTQDLPIPVKVRLSYDGSQSHLTRAKGGSAQGLFRWWSSSAVMMTGPKPPPKIPPTTPPPKPPPNPPVTTPPENPPRPKPTTTTEPNTPPTTAPPPPPPPPTTTPGGDPPSPGGGGGGPTTPPDDPGGLPFFLPDDPPPRPRGGATTETEPNAGGSDTTQSNTPPAPPDFGPGEPGHGGERPGYNPGGLGGYGYSKYPQTGVVYSTSQDVHRTTADYMTASFLQQSYLGLVFRAQVFAPGEPDMRYSANPGQAQIDFANEHYPAVARIQAVSRQDGGVPVFTSTDGNARIRGGTASGVVQVSPPEVDAALLSEYDAHATIAGIPVSTTPFAFADKVPVAWGHASWDSPTGLLDGAVTAARDYTDPNKPLVFAQQVAGAAVPTLKLSAPSGLAAIEVPGKVSLTGVLSPAQIVANTNNYAPATMAGAAILRINTDAARNITGLAGGSDDRILILTNVGAFTITLKHQSGSSTAANRFDFGAADLLLAAGESVLLTYDNTTARWRSVSRSTAAPTAAVADADYGDVVVSGGGTVWTIDAGVVTLAKMADLATARIIGRNTAGTGVPEALATLPTGCMPALTGDVTTPGGSLAATVPAIGSSLESPPGQYITGAAAVTSLALGVYWGIYLGRAVKVNPTVTVVQKVTTGYAAGSGAHIGVAVGASSAGSAPTLTSVGTTDVSGTYNTTGIKTTAITTSGVNIGDELWFTSGCPGPTGTAFQVRGALADELQSGLTVQETGTDIGSLSSTAMTLSSAGSVRPALYFRQS